MQPGLFYHPNRIKEENSPVIITAPHYNSILFFVEQLEIIYPECVKELENLSEVYLQAELWFFKINSFSTRLQVIGILLNSLIRI